jgi:acyl-CoA thioesterase
VAEPPPADSSAADEPAPAPAQPQAQAQERASAPGSFERDTAVWREDGSRPSGDEPSAHAAEVGSPIVFAAEVSPEWRAGRGPHGGYLAAMLTRALVAAVAEPDRAPRSLTIHFARAPAAGGVRIAVAIERRGRSLSTVSARMTQEGKLIALALAAFSVAWDGPEISTMAMPEVPAADPRERAGAFIEEGAPPFTRHIVIQPRLGGVPFANEEQPMEVTGWLGLVEDHPVDAAMLAFLSDALIPAPFMRTSEPVAAPTIDLTVHFRVAMPRTADPDPREMCLVRTRTRSIHDGFFDEDGWIWAADGTLLAQSRQLAILMPTSIG